MIKCIHNVEIHQNVYHVGGHMFHNLPFWFPFQGTFNKGVYFFHNFLITWAKFLRILYCMHHHQVRILVFDIITINFYHVGEDLFQNLPLFPLPGTSWRPSCHPTGPGLCSPASMNHLLKPTTPSPSSTSRVIPPSRTCQKRRECLPRTDWLPPTSWQRPKCLRILLHLLCAISGRRAARSTTREYVNKIWACFVLI